MISSPRITPRGPITTAIRELQDNVRKLTPATGHGVRLTASPSGVTRSALPATSRRFTDDTGAAARWA